jgi:dTDP-4-dehydrorhamnose reductase
VQAVGFTKRFSKESLINPTACTELISSLRPHVIYICAAYTWVDGCEINKEKAFNINSYAPARIAEEAQKVGAKVVYFSSDYIFDGISGPYHESCLPNPVNVYGISKYEGEKRVLEACPEALILRTTVVYGPEEQGKNFIYQMVDSLQKGEEFICAKDQIGTPTYNRDLVSMTLALVKANAKGVYNCVGEVVFFSFSFLFYCATLLGYDANLIKGVTTSQSVERGKAKRGLKLGLVMEKTLKVIEKKYHPNSLQKNLEDWIKRQRGLFLRSGVKSSNI